MPRIPALAIVKATEISNARNCGPVLDREGSAEFADGLRCYFRYSTPAVNGVIATGGHGAASLIMFRRASNDKRGARMASETHRWWALLRHLNRVTRQ